MRKSFALASFVFALALAPALAGAIELKKAGVARVDGAPEPGGGRIAWVATPLLLGRAAR